jgi:hypothetical protein
MNGNGDEVTIESMQVSNNDDDQMPWLVPISPAIGVTATFIWQVFSNESNDDVYSRYWVNTDSVSLDTFDIEADIDPSDPFTAFPISNSWSRSTATLGTELNTDPTTGTNWRPSSGVMAFPTHFMARYGMDEQKMVIDYVGVHYSEATVT